MEKQHPQVELFINTGDDTLDRSIQQDLSTLALDSLVEYTLLEAGITQRTMVTLLITSDDMIQALNKQYRHQNKPTDVLSFPLLEKPIVQAPADQLWMNTQDDDEPRHVAGEKMPAFVTPFQEITNLGDIVISWSVLLRQATEANHSVSHELLLLLAHGVLHLLGYDDQNEAGYQAMVSLQQMILKTYQQKAVL